MTKTKKKSPGDISSLGEFGLIDHLTKDIPNYHPETLMGVGDDAAVIESGQQATIVSKDLLVEGVHFDMAYTPLKHLGYKAIAVNLSDIYAMNARPRQVFVGIAVSRKYTLAALEELYAGMLLACKKYKVDMAGGDTTTSRGGLFISITVVGQAEKDAIVYRSGAQPMDLLYVSGDLGAAYCGQLVLQREKQTFKANPGMQPDISSYAYILERQLRPEPREDVIDLLEKAGVRPTSMIDISDGLASEVLHICKRSNVGATIYEEKIPVDQRMAQTAHEFQIDPTTCALNGGEDYELLFTVRQEDYDKVKDIPLIHPVGHITEASQGYNLFTTSGQLVKLTAQGWDSLKQNAAGGL